MILPSFGSSFLFLPLILLVLIPVGVWFLFKFLNEKSKSNPLIPNHEKKSFSEYPIDLSGNEGKVIWAFRRIINTILINLDYEKVTEEVVNLMITELNYMQLGYKVCVLTLVDKQEQIVRRVSFSQTPEAFGVLTGGNVKFEDVKIPLSADENVLVRAIKDKKTYITHDLSDVFYPEKTREIWREVQKQVGIKTSLIFPLFVRGESIGAMIFSLSKGEKDISEDEKGVLSGFTDAVSVALENTSLYKRLEQANVALMDLDKRKDEFISVAAHELRAPMTAIKGYLSMVIDGDAGEIPPKAKDLLKGAAEGSDRLIRLVNNMLNVSRIEENRMVYNMAQTQVETLIGEVLKDYQLEANKKKLTIIFKKPVKETSKIMVDPDRLEEVIGNLTSNAIKYTDAGSITIALEESNGWLHFRITDTGCGIRDDDKTKLFEKFIRGVEGSRAIGSGLGLYISKLLIEKFGGKIGFESTLGKGSSFWFDLPAT